MNSRVEVSESSESTRYYIARYHEDGRTDFWDGRYGWTKNLATAWSTHNQHKAKPYADARRAKVHPVRNAPPTKWQCAITSIRLDWLKHLAKYGESAWDHMPKKIDGRACTNGTWRPMMLAGLIQGEYKALRGHMDWWFALTDAGRAAIEKAEGRS